jgi:lipoate-protein ligase A
VFCINLNTTDPYFNLAIEEILLKQNEEEYFILGINDPSVIIGKHQSGHRETNTRFVTENQIPVIRRISGGGTVFHDSGNLNFTFIKQSESGRQVDFRKYTRPVIEFLGSADIEARFEGKNDLKVGGYKISGNAEHVYHNRVLHHGTLLFSSSLDMLRNSLRKDTSCYNSRAVSSNPALVRNLSDMTYRFSDISDFRSAMMDYLLNNYSGCDSYELTNTEISQASLLADSKYKSWEWNWAYGPEYTFCNSFNISGKFHKCTLIVKDGIIRECNIEGSPEKSGISHRLVGVRHMVPDLTEAFHRENIVLEENGIYNFF